MSYNMTYEPADITVYVRGRGLVLKEKSLVAFHKNNGKCFAFGAETERMAETEMEDIAVMSPLRRGRVEDFKLAVQLFSHLFVKAQGRKPVFKPTVAVCVPKGITPVEMRAIEDALIGAGAKELYVADIPAEEYVRRFSEQSPKEFRKIKITIGIAKDEPEKYIEEQLRDALTYAGQEQVSRERVCELLKKICQQDDLEERQCAELEGIPAVL